MPAYDHDEGPAAGAIADGVPPSPAGAIADGVPPPPADRIAGGPSSSLTADQASVEARLQAVDEALARLPQLPVAAQVAVFADLHQQLTDALAITATTVGPADDLPRQRPGSGQRSR